MYGKSPLSSAPGPIAAAALTAQTHTRFQPFFMLMTVQPSCFPSSYSAWVKVPTLVSGSPWAGGRS
jgi:hypothetical protein